MAFAGGAFGQASNQNVGQSALAGVTFPSASRNWSADADGSKQAEIDDAATVADRRCGTREYHLWTASNAATAATLRDRVNQTFEDAGWRFNLISRGDDARRTYSLAREARELIMVWLPQNQGIGLLLCAAERDPSSDANAVPPAVAASQPSAPPPPGVTGEGDSTPKDEERVGPPTSNAAAKADREDSQDRAAADGPDYGAAAPTIIGPSGSASPPAAPAGNSWIRFLGWLTAGLLAAGGGFLIYRGLLARGETAVNWPTTPAEIIDARIEMFDQADRKGSVTTWYEPMVVYRYAVGEEWFEGTRLSPDDVTTTDLEEAQDLVERYPVGQQLEIRYRAADPASSTIETGRKPLEVPLYAGAACIVLAVAAFFLIR